MRPRTLIAIASVSLLVPLLTWGQGGDKTQPRPPIKTPKPPPTPRPKATPRVFTNDDLEASKDKGNVQDLQATGVEPYEPPEPIADPPTPPPEPTPEPDPRVQRIGELEKEIQTLDASAKAILWQYLQSGDSNEILRLKAEQQAMLERIEAAKAELAELKGEAIGPRLPTPTPTPPPG